MMAAMPFRQEAMPTPGTVPHRPAATWTSPAGRPLAAPLPEASPVSGSPGLLPEGFHLSAAGREPTGLRLLLLRTPAAVAEVRAADAEVETVVAAVEADGSSLIWLLVLAGPPGPLPALPLLALGGVDGRGQGLFSVADPLLVPPLPEILAAAPGLAFALLAKAAASPRLLPLTAETGMQRALGIWLRHLPQAPGEALATAGGEVLLRLRSAALAAPVALLSAGEAGLQPCLLPLPQPCGPLWLGYAALPALAEGPAPEAVLLRTAAGVQQLPIRRLRPSDMLSAVAEAEATAGSTAAAVRAAWAEHRAALRAALAAARAVPPSPGAPQLLLLAGTTDPFLRRLLVLAEARLSRRFLGLLLAGAEAEPTARWLRPRLAALSVGILRSCGEAARQGGYAAAALVPAGPATLAAALAPAGEARPFPAAVPGSVLLPLAALAEGEEEAAVRHLAGEAPAPWDTPA
jgi:hypothetical protein